MKRLLDVGNCGPDHASIRRLVESTFQETEIVQAETAREAIDALQSRQFDLILVNRIFDYDADSGLSFIESLKADEQFAQTPCMLLTNFEEHQQAAVERGATRGFGKAELNDPSTRDLLAEFLGN